MGTSARWAMPRSSRGTSCSAPARACASSRRGGRRARGCSRPPTTGPSPGPAAAPTGPYAALPVRQTGVIEIPRIGLVHPIYEGIWLTVIDHGPGHWPGTALPGRLGNAVFPGHRVTHTHPFLDLDLLRPGDSIIFEMPYGTYTYVVRDTIIVRPTDTWVVDQHRDREVTLIACHPKHSAAERIVVQGVLVRSQPKGTP